MTQEQKQQLIKIRNEKKQKMIERFKEAKTPQDIIIAYSTYAGNLEALIDMYEIYTD